MRPTPQEIIALENRFWQSMVDHETDAAIELLAEPALMISAHGSMKFDHEGYRKMADHGTMVLKDFELSDMEVVFPSDDTAILMYKARQTLTARDNGNEIHQEMVDSSVWTRQGDRWLCAMHTETPADKDKAH